jgi:hypothetical protein
MRQSNARLSIYDYSADAGCFLDFALSGSRRSAFDAVFFRSI